MLAGIHQTHYLPWLRYFEKAARSDVFIVLDTIQFTKNGWQNRNKIKGPQGAVLLTVPVHTQAGYRLDEVRINDEQPWRRKHWRGIEQCYRKAPYFERYAPFLESTYARPWSWLHELNRHMLEWFVAELGIRTPIRYSSQLDAPGSATERLVNLVRAAGCDAYYSGAYALEVYLDAKQLREAGISLVLQQWKSPEYPQAHPPFLPDLSILDLLMQCGPHSLDVLMKGGTPVTAERGHD